MNVILLAVPETMRIGLRSPYELLLVASVAEIVGEECNAMKFCWSVPFAKDVLAI
jgi:hypothetical protein